jgi:hypothetical protein
MSHGNTTPQQRETIMKMKRMNIQLPAHIKAKLDALKAHGTTASGLIRHLLNQHFNQPAKKGR